MIKNILLIIFTLLPFSLHAETRVTNGYLYEGATWTKENSPYILEDYVTVPLDQKLVIGEGVTIRSLDSVENSEPYTIRIKGGLDIRGKKDEPVRIIGLGQVSLGKNNKIEHAIFERTGLRSSSGTTTIYSSKISEAFTALYAEKSFVEIKDSEISHNDQGIFSGIWGPGPFLMHSDDEGGMGGLGNAGELDTDQNIINITGTILENNNEFSINNRTSNTILAENNWWGNPQGPGESIAGAVIFDPWKTEDPRVIKEICCSNVLFLPGLQASRLYKDENTFFGTTTNRLWEPNRNEDVRKLFLDGYGRSLDSSIYVSGILESAFGIKGIYNKFVAMMNGVVADKTINEWLPLAYDWRMDVSDLVSEKALQEVERLASTSKTGKVTIVAHSNGGLMAKMIGRKMEETGKADLVDKVILVASPLLGTPQAIAGMLHGDNQQLLGGIVLSGGVARTLGLNMSGAYGLLPSEEYFRRFVDPVLSFAGKAINSYESFTNFLTGEYDSRTQPAETDLKNPAVLGKNLLTKSQWMHSLIDSWQFPSMTKVLSIIGWGIPTVETVEYGSSSPRVKKGPDGDGTVLSNSASSYAGDKIFFNQGLLRHDRSWGNLITHADILEAEQIRDVIKQTISTTSETTLPPYISTQKPNALDYPWMSWITVSVHSPVDIDVYDSRGGHIGLVDLPNDPTSDIKWLEDTIGGQYEAFGDEKYITLPAEEDYSVRLTGTGYGNFTFQVQKFVGGDMIEVASTTYVDLPVTPLLRASTTVNALILSPTLNLDVDGNGSADIEVTPKSELDPLVHLDSLKIFIKALNLEPNLEKNLIDKLTKIRNKIIDGKIEKAGRRIKNLLEKLNNKGQQDMAYMLETLLSELD
jgi:hypothetical protein